MKKILYTNYTKFIAIVLFIVSITAGALTVTKGVAEYCDENELIYSLESDFDEIRHFSHILTAPESTIFNACNDFYSVNDKTVDDEREFLPLIINGKTIEQYIGKELDNLYCADKVNYYVKWNDTIFTNCGAVSEQELLSSQFYRLTVRDEKGNIERETSQKRDYPYPLLNELSLRDKTTSIIICTSVKEEYVKECKDIWDRQASIVNETFTGVLVYVILALLFFIYLLCVCGRNKDGERKSMWLDKIWIEIHLAVVGCVGMGTVIISTVLLDKCAVGHFPYNLMNKIVVLTAVIGSSVVLTSVLSVVRIIKCGNFFKSSIFIRCIKVAVNVLIRCRNLILNSRNTLIGALSQKMGFKFIVTLFVYTTVIGLCGVLGYRTGNFILIGVVIFVSLAILLAKWLKEFEEIKTGAREIRNHNSDYKIPELSNADLNAFAHNINEIGKSIDEAVEAKIKAERMKTELITNVSHDLKTPLTSIINYTELLSKLEGLPEEARDYICVIEKKSERLKKLTRDLFDISKAQSGNEDVLLEKLDAELIINQALAEFENEISSSDLTFCTNTQKKLYFVADGRKFSRVISNIISNILKYSMKNTRVFITVHEEADTAVFEFKNVSAYPLDFEAKEITGRFVRGDKSRSEEGNGLGLAIAKSYTQLCNGSFEIITDGDMFKVILKLKKYQ